jgi:hypothetical protein
MLMKFGRPILLVALLVGFASYATIMLRGPHGLRVLAERRAAARQLEIDNADMQHEIDAKKLYIEKLKSDPSAQAIAIKKIIGWQKPNETLFKGSTSTLPAPK